MLLGEISHCEEDWKPQSQARESENAQDSDERDARHDTKDNSAAG